MSFFFSGSDHPWEKLGGGIKRKVVGFTDDLMAVHVCFDKGAIGEIHSHDDHNQIAYIAEGSFEVTVGNDKKILRKGDAYTATKKVLHGAVALEDNSIIIDVFSPARKEFL